MDIRKRLGLAKAASIVLFLGLLVYVSLRAALLSFTHDESLTFTILEGSSDLVDTANNHVLNTILSKVTNALFGSSEFSLRLPNVLSFALYYFSVLSIIRSSRLGCNSCYLIAVLLFNPFVLEFFSLARGYGLSLGFMLASLCYFYRDSVSSEGRDDAFKNAVGALLFGSAALFANLGMVNYLISLCLTLLLRHGFFYKTPFRREMLTNWRVILLFSVVAVSILWGIKRLLLLKKLQHLFFGSETFWDMMSSLIEASLYVNLSGFAVDVMVVLLLLVVVASLVMVLVERSLQGELAGSLMLLGFVLAGLVFENLVFEAKYPRERTALLLLPLFALVSCFLFQSLLDKMRASLALRSLVFAALSIPFLVNFGAGVNIDHSKVWQYDARTKDAMLLVGREAKLIDRKATISNHWLFEPTINYYIVRNSINLRRADREGARVGTDFIFTLEGGGSFPGYFVLESFEAVGATLLVKMDTAENE